MKKIAALQELFQKAKAAGLEAGQKAQVTPMVVMDADVLTGAPIPGGQKYFVPDGICGFASVIVKPGTCSLAKFLVKEGVARKSYYGGVAIPIREFNQSFARKEAAAYAMANVFAGAGIKAYVDSRVD